MSIAARLGRPELLHLSAYRAAAWIPGNVRLHANENPWRAVGDTTQEGLARYPEPFPSAVQARLAQLYGVAAANLLPTRGADEAIDLLCRAFLRAGRDAVLQCPPTFGMYALSAHIQGAEVREVPLTAAPQFRLDTGAVVQALADPRVRLVFLCAPGNPTGVDLPWNDVRAVLEAADGRALVVVDEAYVEFAGRASYAEHLAAYPHLVVLRTLSKAYSLAGARVGSVLADASVIDLLGALLPPYSMATGTIEAVLRALADDALPIATTRIARLVHQRDALAAALAALPGVRTVVPSASNFLYVTFDDAAGALARAGAAGLLLRDFSRGPLTPAALRISMGDTASMRRLLKALETA